MTNKYTSRTPSNIVKAKLKVLLNSVNTLYNSGSMVTEKDLVSSYHSAISLFFQSLDGSITGTTSKFLPGQPPDPIQFNLLTTALGQDIESLFLEVGALDKLVTSSFNSLIASREQVLQKSKKISNKLGDYLLYADPALGAGYFFGDSFNTANRIEVGSSLIDTEECFLGQDEGVVLLPMDGSPTIPAIKSYIINKQSNGNLGNNINPDVVGKDDLAALGDNEPNTWVEYERITAYESSDPLVFDITIVLKDISIINHININPINFGTSTPVKIVTLETSKDGKEYRSIQDEIPIKDFVAESEEKNSIFELSAATNKYAGQGFYSFLPRKAQYIHVVFEQHTPYPVLSFDGTTRLRYAIGLRDINILGRKFKPEGSLVSTPFSIDKEIRKVGLWASENPIEPSKLADVTHAISYDDGANWIGIQPTERSAYGIQEVVNFNTISENTNYTAAPVTTLRHKIYMKRDPDAFEGPVTVKEERLQKTEIINVPIASEPEVTTKEQLIPETLRAVLPFWGSYSCPRAREGAEVARESFPMELDHVDFNVDVPPIDMLKFKLPYKNFPDLKEHLRVFVNGSQWEFCPSNEAYLDAPINTSYAGAPIDENSKVYFLNKNGGELQFGFIDSSNERRGYLPSGAKISVVLDGDNPNLELTGQGYVLNLSAPSDGFKENMTIVYFENLSEAEYLDYQMQIPAGKTKLLVPGISGGAINSTFGESKISKNNLRAEEIIGAAQYGIGPISPYNPDPIAARQNVFLHTDIIDASVSSQAKNNATRAVVSNASNAAATRAAAERDAKNRYLDNRYDGTGDAPGGILPPIFNSSTNSIAIEEYDITGTLVTPAAWTAVAFINGEQEFAAGGKLFSFDHFTGTVHLSQTTNSSYRTVFKCKKLKANVVLSSNWSFYKDPITNQEDTSRILLNSNDVFTLPKIVTVDPNENSASLIDTNYKAHNWFNQRILKGSIKPSSSLFADDSKPVEVPFIDGFTELNNTIAIINEKITFGTPDASNIYTITLDKISLTKALVGSPNFGATRDQTGNSAPVNIFKTQVSGVPAVDGEWSFTAAGIIQIMYSGTIESDHIVSYSLSNNDPGIDASGLYSIDYVNSTIHFANPTNASGTIEVQVSVYSAFYNIAEVINSGDIEEINEDERKIKFSTALGMRFLKLDTAEKARPPFMKLVYEYYKKSTESIKDLEPYFSPICKDVAFRAVTSDLLEEL